MYIMHMQHWPSKPRVFHENSSIDSVRSQLQGAPSPHSPKPITFCLSSASIFPNAPLSWGPCRYGHKTSHVRYASKCQTTPRTVT